MNQQRALEEARQVCEHAKKHGWNVIYNHQAENLKRIQKSVDVTVSLVEEFEKATGALPLKK